jgi:hypothetical protein
MTSYSWLKGRLPTCIMLLMFLACIPSSVLGADVDVYAEGAYTDTELVVYLYADINVGSILSFGVKVNYPAGLTYTDFTKNDAVWYFGDGGADYPYMDPENDGSSVIFIGGKLDTNTPTAGVTGPRVILGTVTFDCAGFAFGHPVNDPAPISIELGRGGNYANFVKTTGDIVDDPNIFTGVTIAKKGDANLDNRITTQDMSTIRYNMTIPGSIPHLWVDCNLDGRITTQDMSCVRYIMTH